MKNILLITADQLRFDAMGFKKVFPVDTPNLDRLAKTGTVFNNAYCTNPLCVPSRASIMTGRYSHQHGVYYNDQDWSPSLDTLAANLSANGYRTVECGKTHFQPNGKHHGFDKLVNERHYKAYLKHHKLSEKSPRPLKTWEEQVAWVYRGQPGSIPLEHYEPVYHTNNAIDELKHMSRTRRCAGLVHEPFFLWLSFLRPHVPCTPPEPYFSMYNPDDIPPPVRREGEEKNFPQPLRDFHKLWAHMPEETTKKIRAQYLADVTIVDQQVGRMLDTLDELNMAASTIVIFSSDHGDHLGDHDLHQKGFFLEPSVRVPLIMAGPDIDAGRSTDANVSLIDLLPTAMEAADLYQDDLYNEAGQPLYHNQPPSWSRSLLTTLREEASPCVRDRCVIAETALHGQGIMVKHQHHKYCWYPQSDELQVFDLSADPEEFSPRQAAMNDLPAPVRDALARVKQDTDTMADRRYFYNGRQRPMFT